MYIILPSLPDVKTTIEGIVHPIQKDIKKAKYQLLSILGDDSDDESEVQHKIPKLGSKVQLKQNEKSLTLYTGVLVFDQFYDTSPHT